MNDRISFDAGDFLAAAYSRWNRGDKAQCARLLKIAIALPGGIDLLASGEAPRDMMGTLCVLTRTDNGQQMLVIKDPPS